MTNNIEDIEDIFGFPKVKKEREEAPANEDFSDRIQDVKEVMNDVDETVSISNDLGLIEETEEVTEVVELDESIFGEMGEEEPEIPHITTDIPETIFVDDVDIPPRSTKDALEETLAETVRVSQTTPLIDIVLDPVKENETMAKEESEMMEVTEVTEVTEEIDKDDNIVDTDQTECNGDNDDYTNHLILPDGEVNWITSNPSAKFNYFYKQKISIIESLLRGRQLPFQKYEDELRKSYCDVGSNIFDLPQLYLNMTRVQQLRDRVCQIQTEVNSQYYKWERTVELLRGVLARTQYERGKQEGVQFEHMRDMEIYLESLKSIHKTADIIHKNLDAASDLLSRQVTIAQAGKSIDRNESSYNSNVSSSHSIETYIEQETPEKLTDYDELPSSGVSVTTVAKVKRKSAQGPKKINWDEM